MRLFLIVGLAVLAATAEASPWPVASSVAYVEELSIACAKAVPESAPMYEARKSFLFSEDFDQVKKAQAGSGYTELRRSARDIIQNVSASDLAEECRSLLTRSNLALKQADPYDRKPVPVKSF
jgi:hypothetical protein